MHQLAKILLQLHNWFLARPQFKSINLHLLKLNLRSLGVLNSDTATVTGEPYWLSKLAQSGQINTIIDVGANDAAYGATELPNAQIFAFEPHPASYQRLKQHAPANVTPVHAAVGDSDGKTTLWDFADSAPKKSDQPTSQLASLYKEVITNLHGQPAKKYTVPLVSLDVFAKQQHIKHIDLLKIDAEGHELVVLRGAKKLLENQQISIIQFEFNEMMAYSHTHFFDFVQLLPDFTFYRLLPTGLLPLGAYRPLTHEIFGFQNVVAISGRFRLKIE